jgi:Kef-type K+ transport system membrane component KefB
MELKQFLLSLITIYISARVMGELAVRLGQPAVLGELVAGVLLGASVLGVVQEAEPLKLFGEIGIIVLLFEVGLESDLQAFLNVGWSVVAVATIGVLAPFLLGYWLAVGLQIPPAQAAFIGAALTPTSVAIPARVLHDLGKLHTHAGRIILGAAVLDDVLALVVLSVCIGLTESSQVSGIEIGRTAGLAVLFLGLAVVIGVRYAHLIAKLINRMQTRGGLLITAMTFALMLGYGAEVLRLSPLLGALAAGLILARTEPQARITEQIKPVADIFVPVFFVLVGVAMDLSYFNPFNPQNGTVLLLAGGLTVAAVVGKLACGLGVMGQNMNRWGIGAGMVPRGEFVLIFASLGLSHRIIPEDEYGAILVVVVVTTLLAPLMLKPLFRDTAC